jgi:hypothetical protein
MEENKRPKIIILGLGELGHEEFMEVFYNLIISSPEDILGYDETPEHKIAKLNHLLEFFEEREQYEKCAKIKEIQELINLEHGK